MNRPHFLQSSIQFVSRFHYFRLLYSFNIFRESSSDFSHWSSQQQQAEITQQQAYACRFIILCTFSTIGRICTVAIVLWYHVRYLWCLCTVVPLAASILCDWPPLYRTIGRFCTVCLATATLSYFFSLSHLSPTEVEDRHWPLEDQAPSNATSKMRGFAVLE